MDKLREEVLEAEKMRADLIKWKLVLVAALGSVGIGLQEDMHDDTAWVLCLIPFVCAYVDLAARHLNLRIHVIAEFTRRQKNASNPQWRWAAEYEEYAQSMHKKKVFGLETWVLRYSTIFLSGIIIVAGFITYGLESLAPTLLFILSGSFGIVAASLIDRVYRKRLANVTSLTFGSS